jgi:L-asparaginase / beta-aspartyl-peptidase
MPKRMAGNSTNAQRISIAVLVALSCTWSVRADDVAPATGGKMFALAVHGGAGTLSRSEMTPAQEKEYREGLSAALDAGYALLGRGASSLDAVIAAVRVLEDNPLFNAGRGAVLNRDGVAELDASLMDGRTLGAGAVTGLQHVRNPIDLARLVMDKSPHVMLVGAGAEEFAKLQGMEMVPNEYFRTPARQRQLERSLRGAIARENELQAFGTVGAVALDLQGNLAAATSTGGMTGKRWGRVGDSPIIGAGTYANNESCAVSATGHGEYFIRTVVAHDICAQVEYLKIPLSKAVDNVLNGRMKKLGGNGGVIAIDPGGEIVLDFNSEGMFRGVATSKGRREVAIYR